MKKLQFLVLTATLGWAGASHAALIMDEPFDYADGPLTTVSGGQWVNHSGTAEQVDVTAGKVNLTFGEREDVHRDLAGGPFSTGVLYASFVVNFSDVPGATGSYFTHFNASGFRARVFATTSGAATDHFRVGIANGTTSFETIPTDLALGQDYLLVVRYDIDNAASTLWINPSSDSSLVDRADASDAQGQLNITAFSFRQSGGIGTLTLDDLKIGDTFGDVAAGGNSATNPPVVSAIPDQSIPPNAATPALDFTVNDGETAPANLVVTATSSNPSLVPNTPANLILTGSDINRTLTVVPAAGQQGSAIITLSAQDSDGNIGRSSFTVVVGAPAISRIPNQITTPSTPSGPIPFVIGDGESPAASLTLSGKSSDQLVVADANIVFGGSGSNRTVTVTPTGLGGFVHITVTVSDGANNIDSTFGLSVNPLSFVDNPSDNFDYPDGPIVSVSTFKWETHSGTPEEMQVMNGKLQLSQTLGEDVSALVFGGPLGIYGTNDGIVVYSSFAVRFSALPAGNGSYFAHYKDGGTFNYRGRVHATTNGAAPGFYRLGIANGSGPASAVFPLDLALEDVVIVTTRYNVSTAETVLWVNALSENDPSVAATDVADPAEVWAFAFRQGSGIGVLSVDDLILAGTFADVFQQPPPPNTSPVISPIADQSTDVDVAVGPLPLTIGDAETAAGNLLLTGVSDNPTLIPNANIVFGGSGSNRTVTVTPAPGEFGTATITLTVQDEGERRASTSFSITVLAANNPPFISAIPDQQTPMDTPTLAIPFLIGDRETAANGLTLAASSSDPALVPEANIVFGGSGSNRTVTVTPAGGATGAATITVAVSDDAFTITTSFRLLVTLGELLIEPFDYADGSIITNSAFFWDAHSGDTGETQVAMGKLQLSQDQREDIHASLLGAPYDPTNSIVLYAGFTVNFSELPGTGNGNYFAHFRDDEFGFRGRIFAGTGNAADGQFRLGIANTSSSGLAQFPMDLSLDTTYQVVVRFNVATATSTLWVNPTAETDPGAGATDVASPVIVTTFAFRQSGGIGILELDDLKVGTTFASVIPEPAVALQIVPAGTGVEITWPASATGYVLQSTDALPGGIWSEYSDQGTPDGGRIKVTITPTSGNRFFRLLRP